MCAGAKKLACRYVRMYDSLPFPQPQRFWRKPRMLGDDESQSGCKDRIFACDNDRNVQITIWISSRRLLYFCLGANVSSQLDTPPVTAQEGRDSKTHGPG